MSAGALVPDPGPLSERISERREGALAVAAAELLEKLLERSLTIVCAESCTGGLVSAALTDIAGASRSFRGAFVAYSNEFKERVLGVPFETLCEKGAVSRECAKAMARAALAASGADIALAITGIAGPEGGSPEKPVGLVWFAWADSSGSREEMLIFSGDRASVRAAAAERALRGALEVVSLYQKNSDDSRY